MAIQRDKVIANAEKLVAKGKIEPAIKEYERLLDDNPTDVNTLNRIGDLWVRINRTDEAVRVFITIADHYSKDGFFLKAIAIYKKINKLDPSKLEVYAKLADLYAKQGLAMEAKSQYQVLADYYLKHSDPGNALGIYRKISELDPNSINIHVKLADLYSQNNQKDEALKEYDRVGKMLLKRGMIEEALQVFRKAMKLDAGNVELAESLVTTLLESKDYANAVQLLESTLEANKQNPKLVALLGRTYIAKGDLDTARTVLEKGLHNNPTDLALREQLADVHLRQGDPDEALSTLGPLVESLSAKRDRAAVDLLNKIVKAEPLHTPTLTKLVEVYTALREESNIVTALNSLAEAHIATRDFAPAATVLQDLVRKEPENAQHRKKLAFVQEQMGGAPAPAAAPAAAPSRPAAPPKPAALPIEPEPPIADFSMDVEAMEDAPADAGEISMDLDMSQESEISFDLDASPGMDLSFDEPAPAPAPAKAEFEQPSFSEPSFDEPSFAEESIEMSFDEPSATAVEEPAGEDLDFITEHLTEAEVFAKYGLSEKAIEHLRAVLTRAPRHVEAHEKLLKIFLEEGENEEAQAIGTSYLNLLRETGNSAAYDAAVSQMASRGISVGGAARAAAAPQPAARPAATPRPAPAPIPPPVEQVEPAPEEEISFDVGGEQEVEFDLDTAEEEIPLGLTEQSPVVELTESAEPLPEETLGMPDFSDKSLFGEAEASDFAIGEEPSPEPDFGPPEETYASGPAVEEIGEIDFYIEQELYEEARDKLDSLLSLFPDDPELLDRQLRLDVATAAPPAPPEPEPVAPAPQAFSAADIENELMSAIPEDDDEIEIHAKPAAQMAAPAPVDEGNLFAEEDDFFDLAAELEEELEEEGDEPITLSEEEQSLEDIFREFKKGVEQQLDSEDYDTHYNLGIAYKEMGLIDEAIGEFQLASKDPKRAIECCSMLGLCFLEKGMPQLAIKWYRKGIEVPEITEDEHLGLLYDLGSAYLEVGDTDNAHKVFLEIYGANTNYRDIVSRIKSLEDVRSK